MTDTYPNSPGVWAGAPETSSAAAESVAEAAKNREILALRLITAMGGYGATVDEVAAVYQWERYSSRPRVATLHADGKVIDSGKRRRAVSDGRQQAVWIVPQCATEDREVAHG